MTLFGSVAQALIALRGGEGSGPVAPSNFRGNQYVTLPSIGHQHLDHAARAAARGGGFQVRAGAGAPDSGWAVSTDPSRASAMDSEALTTDDLEQFITDNADLWSSDAAQWPAVIFDQRTGKVVLAPLRVTDSEAEGEASADTWQSPLWSLHDGTTRPVGAARAGVPAAANSQQGGPGGSGGRDTGLGRSLTEPAEYAVGARSPWGRSGLYPEAWGPPPIRVEARMVWARNRIVLGQHEARAGNKPPWLGDGESEGSRVRQDLLNRYRQLALARRRWGP